MTDKKKEIIKDDKKRTLVTLHLSNLEKSFIKNKANEVGMNFSQYIRHILIYENK